MHSKGWSVRRHANERASGSQKRGGDGNILGFLSFRGLQHYIRLRKLVQINDQLSAELGVDLSVKRQNYIPQAALTYQVLSYRDNRSMTRVPMLVCDISDINAGIQATSLPELSSSDILAPALQIQKDGKKIAVLRATRQSLFVRKTFTLTPPKVDVSFNLHTTAGISYKGER